MELPEQEKHKIRDEEQRRLAEEQYRQQVRSELAGSIKPAVRAKKSTLTRVLRLIFVALVRCTTKGIQAEIALQYLTP